MHIRATRVQVPPDKVKEAIANFQTNTLPGLRKAPGNQGAVLLVNRQTGEAIGATYWESGKAMGAAEQIGTDSRTQSVRDTPGTQIINVERVELMIMDRAAPPTTGSFVRSVTGSGDPDKLDAAVSFARTKALPVFRSIKGYRALLIGVDRQTGRVLASSVWDTLEDLNASESKVAGTRAEFARTAGINPQTLEVKVFESAVAEFSPAAAAVAQATRS